MALGAGRRLTRKGTPPKPAQNTLIHLAIYFAHAQGFQDATFHPLDAENRACRHGALRSRGWRADFAGDMP